MSSVAKEILHVNLEDEMRQSYLDYAMSVIVGRALPDVRDGLKPVHRRVLYAMKELGNDWNKAYKKSARVVGDVIGKYHPHGDSAVYDTIVRMAQPFSLRYMLVDGQGNFGSIDGDNAAAMRYTEVRMARIAHELLADIEKETVDFDENYDGSESEPTVLPAKIPNLLVNGGSGIAVGMATNIPPHNLGEVVDACIALIDDESLDIDGLMEYIPAPDLPTGAIINGVAGIREAYRTGRGRMVMRARAEFEEDSNGRQRIVVSELPYQVNKARLLEKIAELVKEKRIEGITELRDESDKDGIRMVIELRRGEVGEVVLNNLFQQTQLQTVFGINMVGLVDGQPRLLNLKDILEVFVRHRREVVTRRTVFDLRKARERAHILEGLAVALANIDEVIALIKASPGPAEAREALVSRVWQPGSVTSMLERAGADASRPDWVEDGFGLSEDGYRLTSTQAQAILDLRLHRLTGLEQDKILDEFQELLTRIAELLEILSSSERLLEVIREELEAIKEQYNDPRRSEVLESTLDLTLEDLIAPEDVVVTLSHTGYAKSQPLDSYQAQRRGGKGKSATKMKEEDFIDKLFVANTHDTLLCFSSAGKVYWLKVYQLPQGSRNARGKPIVNLLPLEGEERINAVLPIKEFDDEHFVFFATRNGTVKKTPLSHFSRPRSSGIIALNLHEDDHLVNVGITDGESEVMLFTSGGKAMRFREDEVRAMGRTAAGVRGVRLPEDQHVIELLILGEGDILTATERGYGKRTPLEEYPTKGRGGMGVISIQGSERNGAVVGACQVVDQDEIMLITKAGTLVRTRVAEISRLSRNTQGVKLISLGEDEPLVSVERIEALGEDGEAEDEGPADEAGAEE
ncbi:DNA gyrase subunit A [Alkalilimnicola sp. S0819]|uniref:DNA gyrase subunit A n=1 Tax=Alkalilimnicola sp. S0819 TaxID=2613922 RepID=UPI001261DBD2|nr:DNA gyrase subunit A [Alkalilimnicola sp. S0819]KAB7623666.1 DNA gyrase subunit A [Alkalilimnicola sp. S0819]MPQ16790.1 DNA gyrase subunit A [Alkalilimnicola sp. S0819]